MQAVAMFKTEGKKMVRSKNCENIYYISVIKKDNRACTFFLILFVLWRIIYIDTVLVI